MIFFSNHFCVKVKEDTQTKLEDFKTECEGKIQSLMDKNNVRLKEVKKMSGLVTLSNHDLSDLILTSL